MNSYPAELLQHHYACMMVAGLTAASPPIEGHPTTVFPELTQSLHDVLASRGKNTVWDPARGRSAVFHTVFASSHTVRLPPHKTKPSAKHLVTALDPDAVVPPQAAAAFASLPARSPLSPLHPNSALFPDGLIAPIWVRKHTELIPSVFVAFYTLQAHAKDSSDEAIRKADQDLIDVIAERKRSLTERGVKLTIVLLAHREMLEDEQLEARLSFIRRSSGLDSRASLFVLTPVSRAELGEFVTSLHSALFEAATDYYREHARRVKRKRARYPPPQSTLVPITHALASIGSNTSQPHWLSREGWIVRSEYKLAVFAQLQGDNAEALLRYREAYNLLCNSPSCLLGSTLMLPPRSKRWAEAKVLADTIIIKICQLCLYSDDIAMVLPTFRRHLARFTELSTGWGIGTMTFEFWSWLAKQYRMLGDLLEQATTADPPLELDIHAPPLPAKLLHPDALAMFAPANDANASKAAPTPLPPLPLGMLTPNQNAIASAVIPFSMLQGPGAYFYLAALCTLERKTRYLRALELSTEIDGPLSHEHKFDHTAQTVEHLTKASNAFKRVRSDRTAFLVAAHLASIHYDARQYTQALAAVQPMLDTMDKGADDPARVSLLAMATECAVQCRDVPAALRLFLDMAATTSSDAASALHGLETMLLQRSDEHKEEAVTTVKIQYNSALHQSVFDVETVFPLFEAECGAAIPFQLRIRNQSAIDLRFLSLRRMVVHFSANHNLSPIEISCGEGDAQSQSSLAIVDVGTLRPDNASSAMSTDANVSAPHGHIVVQGKAVSATAGPIQIDRLVLSSDDLSSLGLELDFTTAAPVEDLASSDMLRRGDWLLPSGKRVNLTQRAAPGVTLVQPRSYAITVSDSIQHDGCYYVDQRIPIVLTVRNCEEVELVDCWLDVVLQPTYEGASHDILSLSAEQTDPDESVNTNDSTQSQTARQFIHEYSLGTLSSEQTQSVKVWFTPSRMPGNRTLDVTLHVRASTGDAAKDVYIIKKSIALSVTSLFETSATIKSLPETANKARENNASPSLMADLFGTALPLPKTPEKVSQQQSLVETQITMIGPASIHVSAVRAVSLDTVGPYVDVTGVWTAGDRFCLRHMRDHVDPNAGLEIVWTTSSTQSDDAVHNITRIPISNETASTDEIDQRQIVTINLTHASTMTLHQPAEVHLSIANTPSNDVADVARTVSVDVNIDSTEHFAFAGARRLSHPHILPLPLNKAGTTSSSRIVPLKIGKLPVPTFSFRVSVPSEDDRDSNSVLLSTNTASSSSSLLGDAIHVKLIHTVIDPDTKTPTVSTLLHPTDAQETQQQHRGLYVLVRPIPS